MQTFEEKGWRNDWAISEKEILRLYTYLDLKWPKLLGEFNRILIEIFKYRWEGEFLTKSVKINKKISAAFC